MYKIHILIAKRYLKAVILILLFILTGCKPLTETIAYLEYHNLKIGLARTTMTITFGDGSVNARTLMDSEHYVGSVNDGRVTIFYPDGLKELAGNTLPAYSGMYDEIKKKVGIDWCFDLEIRFVRVDAPISGFSYAENLRRGRRLVFPLFVIDGRGQAPFIDPRLAAVIAHEVTEASLIAPQERHSMVMSDLFGGPFCIPYGTRWFRDGVSDYAADLMGERLFGDIYPGSTPNYQELSEFRVNLLSWSNCDGSGSYEASRALLQKIINQDGEQMLPKLMKEMKSQNPQDGSAIRGAILKTTNRDIREFLQNYRPAWLGMDVRNTCTSHSGMLLCPDNQVVVTRVHSNSPASRRGVKAGDVILMLDGTPMKSTTSFLHIEAQSDTEKMIPMEIQRGNERISLRIKPTLLPLKFIEQP